MALASPFGRTSRLRRVLFRGHRRLQAGNIQAAEYAGRQVLRCIEMAGAVRSGTSTELECGSLELIALARRELCDFRQAVLLHTKVLTLLDGLEVHDRGEGPPDRSTRARGTLPRGEAQRLRCSVHLRFGESLRLLARYTDAERHHRRALVLAESAEPQDPAVLAWCHNGLGIVYKDTKRYEAAAESYSVALTLATRHLGQADPRLSSIHHNLAGLAHIQGKFIEAEPHIRRALG